MEVLCPRCDRRQGSATAESASASLLCPARAIAGTSQGNQLRCHLGSPHCSFPLCSQCSHCIRGSCGSILLAADISICTLPLSPTPPGLWSRFPPMPPVTAFMIFLLQTRKVGLRQVKRELQCGEAFRLRHLQPYHRSNRRQPGWAPPQPSELVRRLLSWAGHSRPLWVGALWKLGGCGLGMLTSRYHVVLDNLHP